ncbi:MAG: hypothetical protein AABZ60_24110 [Planctomycetota bacterium]
MSNPSPSAPILDPKTENIKKLHMAGSMLFILGLITVMAALLATANPEKMSRMVLSAAILLAFGCPLMLHSKALEKILILEKRLADLEKCSKS